MLIHIFWKRTDSPDQNRQKRSRNKR